MEKNNINALVTIGKSKKFKPSNRFEMNVAELVTSLILDPSYGLNCSFVSENNKTSLVISPVSSMYRFEPVTVHIDGKESLTRDLQLISATAKVHKFLNQRKLLNPYEFVLSQGEHILLYLNCILVHAEIFQQLYLMLTLEYVLLDSSQTHKD